MADKKPSLLSRYEDPTGEFSNQSLQLATWYARHRDLLRKICIVVLSVWSAGTLGISLFAVGKYVVFDYARDQENLKSLSNSYISRSTLERFEPTIPIFSPPQVFSGVDGRYDFSVVAHNPNASWVATIRYRFEYAGGATAEYETVVLPAEERPIVVFGHTVSTRPTSIEFRVLSISWERIDPHHIANPQEYITERINISIDNFRYVPVSSSGGQVTPVVEFSVTNNSLFDFWEFSGVVEFSRDGNTIGYAPIVISQFTGGETRLVSLGILSSLSVIHSVRLFPSVNVFDTEVFMVR